MTELHETPPLTSELRPALLILCGAFALIGNIAPVVTMGISAGIAEHDLVADTISDLGRGPHKWIMDLGFFLNAAAMLALALAAAHLHLDGTRWTAGLFALTLLALLVTMIGLWDRFQTEALSRSGLTVHTWLTFGLAPLYLAGPILMAPGAARWRAWMRPVFYGSAALWIVFATAFKLAPNTYDGLLEKIAVAATLGWTLPLGWLFLSAGLGAWRQTDPALPPV